MKMDDITVSVDVALRTYEAFFHTAIGVFLSQDTNDEQLAKIGMALQICLKTLETNGEFMRSNDQPNFEELFKVR